MNTLRSNSAALYNTAYIGSNSIEPERERAGGGGGVVCSRVEVEFICEDSREYTIEVYMQQDVH